MMAQVISVQLVRLIEFGTHDVGEYFATIDNPSNDYDGFKDAPNVLKYKCVMLGKSAFNSDKGYICYTSRAYRNEYAEINHDW